MAAESAAPAPMSSPKLSLVVPQHRATRIDVPHLVEYLDGGSAVVVDVRDQDYKGGHIPGAVHVPYELFDTNIDEVLKKFTDNSKKYVLYCMYSRERAPACADMLLAKLTPTDGSHPPDVHVLTGGFNAWVNHFTKVSTDASGKATFSLDEAKRVADFEANLYTTVTENKSARVVYRRDVDDHSYSIRTPSANQSGPFAQKK